MADTSPLQVCAHRAWHAERELQSALVNVLMGDSLALGYSPPASTAQQHAVSAGRSEDAVSRRTRDEGSDRLGAVQRAAERYGAWAAVAAAAAHHLKTVHIIGSSGEQMWGLCERMLYGRQACKHVLQWL